VEGDECESCLLDPFGVPRCNALGECRAAGETAPRRRTAAKGCPACRVTTACCAVAKRSASSRAAPARWTPTAASASPASDPSVRRTASAARSRPPRAARAAVLPPVEPAAAPAPRPQARRARAHGGTTSCACTPAVLPRRDCCNHTRIRRPPRRLHQRLLPGAHQLSAGGGGKRDDLATIDRRGSPALRARARGRLV
jgi:hypothetical protein